MTERERGGQGQRDGGREPFVARLGAALTRVASRTMPDPFVLALGLTGLVLLIGAIRLRATDRPVMPTLLEGWMAGFSSPPLLAFALQMCLVLVTGHALATSPPVSRGIGRLARIELGPSGSAALVAFVSCLAAFVHWGLGAIVGAFLAREMFRHATASGRRLDYPLLGAGAYSGFAIWHGGLSGSAPLKVAEEGHFAASLVGTIPVTETLFSSLNLVVTGSLVLLIPVLFWMMGRGVDRTRIGSGAQASRDSLVTAGADMDAVVSHRSSSLDSRADSNADSNEAVGHDLAEGTAGDALDEDPPWHVRLTDSPLFGAVFGGLGLLAVATGWTTGALRFDLDFVNLSFFFAGLAGQGGVRRYVAAVAEGARGAGAIIVQFPLYFGVLGVMRSAGLIDWLSEAIVSVASADTFPLVAFLGAGALNLFVPSGGGQWAVQGEILFGAGGELGVAPATTVMAFAYGDAWTNLLQPFWALPLLGIMGLKAREIVGYTAVICLAMGVWVPMLLFWLG